MVKTGSLDPLPIDRYTRGNDLSTVAKPALGTNCMIQYIKMVSKSGLIFIILYGIMQFGPKAGLAPVDLSGCDQNRLGNHACENSREIKL